jgi:hypothetical protein
MEPKGSLVCLQKPTIGPYLEPVDYEKISKKCLKIIMKLMFRYATDLQEVDFSFHPVLFHTCLK